MAVIIKAKCFTYLGIVILITFLCLYKIRLKHIWWRTLLFRIGSIFAAFALLYFGRPDLQVSFQGTLITEGHRVAYELLEKRGDPYQIAVRFVKNQKPWEAPSGYSYETISLTNSKLEILQPSNDNGKIIYELHGGAYIIPLSNQYRDTAVSFSKISNGAAVAMPYYRVAPENVYPAALDGAI